MTKAALVYVVFLFLTLSGLQAQPPEYLYAGNTQTSVYSINTSTGALTQITGSPFPVGGTAIAFHPSGQFAYLANFSGNGLIAATIDATGALHEIPGSPYFAGGYTRAVAIDPSGHYAYVAGAFRGENPGIYPFTIDGDEGALTPAAVPPVILQTNSIQLDPSGKFLFAASPSGISVFSINPKSGGLSLVDQVPASCELIAINPASEIIYLGCGGGVAAYSFDENSGTLTAVPGSPFRIGGGSDPIAVDHTGRFFYTSFTDTLGELIDPDTGALEFPLVGSPFQFGATALAINQTDRFLYSSRSTENYLLGFSISKTSGTLKKLPGSPFLGITGPVFAAIAPALKSSQAALVSLAIKPANRQIIFTPGLTPQFTALGTYDDGTTRYLTASATWSSSDTTVATISNTPGSQGRAALFATGQTTITATLGGVSASTTLFSNPLAVVSIAVAPSNPLVVVGTAIQLHATGTFNNGTKQDLTATAAWSSSNTAVATVNARGIVNAIAAGTAVITAASGSVAGSSTLTVNP